MSSIGKSEEFIGKFSKDYHTVIEYFGLLKNERKNYE
tara:strand:+ start:81 stop:191 length:111 start_codon:yes stop_codon:yes gene_type:complete